MSWRVIRPLRITSSGRRTVRECRRTLKQRQVYTGQSISKKRKEERKLIRMKRVLRYNFQFHLDKIISTVDNSSLKDIRNVFLSNLSLFPVGMSHYFLLNRCKNSLRQPTVIQYTLKFDNDEPIDYKIQILIDTQSSPNFIRVKPIP